MNEILKQFSHLQRWDWHLKAKVPLDARAVHHTWSCRNSPCALSGATRSCPAATCRWVGSMTKPARDGKSSAETCGNCVRGTGAYWEPNTRCVLSRGKLRGLKNRLVKNQLNPDIRGELCKLLLPGHQLKPSCLQVIGPWRLLVHMRGEAPQSQMVKPLYWYCYSRSSSCKPRWL